MPLLLSSKRLLQSVHHAAEAKRSVRSPLLLATSAAAGLAMAKTGSSHRAPIALAAGGAALSFFGYSAIGDGAGAAGTTMLGYKFGAKRQAQKQAAAARAAAPVGPAKHKRR